MQFPKWVNLSVVCWFWLSAYATAQPPNGTIDSDKKNSPGDVPNVNRLAPITADKTILSLSKEGGVWIDLSRKWVVVDGSICLRDGQLEMFACPRQTKEHESVVSVASSAKLIHAALLAVGAKTGTPVQFDPSYKRATGAVVDIVMVWKNDKGNVQASLAQDWIRKGNGKKTMEYAWVFGGSGFWKDPNSGEKHYYGDDGSLVCLSNFPTATLDLPVESTKDNNALMFSANTVNIPPLKTAVRMVLLERKDVDPKRVPKALVKSEELINEVQKWAQALEDRRNSQ